MIQNLISIFQTSIYPTQIWTPFFMPLILARFTLNYKPFIINRLMDYEDSLIDIFRAEYRCPISKLPMTTPVVAFDGVSYEEKHILDWFENHDVFPESEEKISSQELFENATLNSLINRVEIEVPKILSTLKQLKAQIKAFKLENQRLKNSNQNHQLQPFECSEKPPASVFFNSLQQQAIISEDSLIDKKVAQTKRTSRSSRLKQKLHQRDPDNQGKENQDHNRKQQEATNHLHKTKSIKKDKHHKQKHHIQPIEEEEYISENEAQEVCLLLHKQIEALKEEKKNHKRLIEAMKKQINLSNSNTRTLTQEISQLKERVQNLSSLKTQMQRIKSQNEQLKQQINQNHAKEVKRQFQLSQATKLRDSFQKQRDQLLTKFQNQHMTWMFIFSIYEETIFSYVKESDLKEKIIKQENQKLQKIQKDPPQPNPNEFQIGFYSDSSDSFIPPAKRQTKKPNRKVTKAIQNLEQQYKDDVEKQRKQIQMISEVDEERMKDNKLKEEITSRIQLLEVMLSSKLKENPAVDKKAVKQVKKFYKKISLLSKTLPDQTPWNLWNAYKFYTFQTRNQKNNITYGYQLDGGCLLKILRTFGDKSLEWKELKFIKAHDSGIDDAGWKYLVKHAHLMPGLVEIDLEGNQITKVTKKDLEGWKKLLWVTFDRNPLNQESCQVVEQYSKKNAMSLE